MTAGRHIVARAVLLRTERGYEGALKLWGFVYGLEITRHADGVQVVVYDGPVMEAYRIPLLDGDGG